MRCGDPSNPRLIHLQKLLGCETYAAVGIIECLAIFTREYCRNGFTGKYSDDHIACWIEWEQSSPERLIGCLVESGWLLRVDPGRLFFNEYNGRLSKVFRRKLRMRAAGGEISRALRLKIYGRDDWTCRHCGSKDDITLDHITPVAAGGTNAESNLQVLCRKCNGSKRDNAEVGR